jgi:hypothetical protein
VLGGGRREWWVRQRWSRASRRLLEGERGVFDGVVVGRFLREYKTEGGMGGLVVVLGGKGRSGGGP